MNETSDRQFHAPVRFVGQVPFLATTPAAASAWLVEVAAAERIPVNVRLANAYNVALAEEDSGYAELLGKQGLNLPDGSPVVWAMNFRRRGCRRGERVRGPSLFKDVMRDGVEHHTTHFLLGGSPSTLEALETNLTRNYPGIRIVGRYSPPFVPVSSTYVEECAAAVRCCDPDLVWVGLGTPKQDIVGSALASLAQVTTINVGAAFDFVGGTAREAPVWVQNSGFEWLFRLATEPKRLWRRYLLGNFRFLVAVLFPRGRRSRDGVRS